MAKKHKMALPVAQALHNTILHLSTLTSVADLRTTLITLQQQGAITFGDYTRLSDELDKKRLALSKKKKKP